jgi:receptor expression-enhancing protein 5/6
MSETEKTPLINNKELMNQLGVHLKLIEKKTGQNPKIILGILAASLIFVIIGYLEKYITCIVGIVLPTYWSIKAIESNEGDDDKQWLTYWAVYAVFDFLDLFAGFILKIIPFYYILKLIFLIWCFMPNTQGALIVYNHIIKKFFIKYENNLDQLVNKVMKRSQETTQRVREEIEKNKDKIASAGISAANAVNDALKTD